LISLWKNPQEFDIGDSSNPEGDPKKRLIYTSKNLVGGIPTPLKNTSHLG